MSSVDYFYSCGGFNTPTLASGLLIMQTDYSLKCNLEAICLFPSKFKLLPISFGIPLNCTVFLLYRRNRLPLQPFFHAEALHL